jgi:ABC-type Mn2+/Zn2+ transport system permease subunit
MIDSFVDSWSLFQHAYLAGWLIGLLLSMVGVLVVARDQIFIGVAVSQASVLGIALGLGLGGLMGLGPASWLRSESFLSLMAVVGAVLAALLTARGGTVGRESPEAITGWVFLLSASGSILLVAHSPFGLDEIYRLLSSSIIGATPADVWTFGSFTLVTLIALGLTHRRLLLFAMDPAMATAVGMRVPLWAGGTAVWLGLAVGLSMRVSGVLYTCGNLVLPALVAKHLCGEVGTVFVVAPCIALGTGALGFILANYYDYPPAQMTVALLSVCLLVAWCLHGLRRHSGL